MSVVAARFGMLRILAVSALFAELALSACECGGGGALNQLRDAGQVGRCKTDDDCGPRMGCYMATGVCFPRDACGPDKACPNPEQMCVTNPRTGFMECVFKRCMDVSECQSLNCPSNQIKACIQGGCTCGEPCQGGCGPGQGCCIPENQCHPLPPECMGLMCPRGQFLSVTSSGAWSTGDCRIVGEMCSCQRLPPLPLGDIGLYSSIAHDDLNPVMSAYNLTYGDLMFGTVRGTTIDWEFIDGVPTSSTAPATGDLDGPRGGISAPGPDVGIYTDIKVDDRGRPHISYQDRDRHALKYAHRGQLGWRTHVVQGDGHSDTGLYSSLALDVYFHPRIAFLAAREPAGGNERRSVLRLAFSATTAPGAAIDWAMRDIDTLFLTGLPCADRCNAGEVCRSSDKVCVVPDRTPCGTCMSPNQCIQGVCTATDPLPPYRDLPLARGLWPSLVSLPDGGVVIAYYDRRDHQLKVARIMGNDLRGAPITIRAVDGTGVRGSSDDAGFYPSLLVTGAGAIHLSYLNATRHALWHRVLDQNLDTVSAEAIDEGLDMSEGPEGVMVGANSSLVIDSGGTIRVAYQDATHGLLKYAVRAPGATDWSLSTLAGGTMPYRGSFGFYARQTLDQQREHAVVSSYRYFLSAPMRADNGISIFRPQ